MSAIQVLKIYPNAKPIKDGKIFYIVSEERTLGKGQSKKCAWKSSIRNINGR